jgi:predicted Zn-dependent protease
MTGRLRHCLLFPLRHPLWALWGAVLLAGCGYLLWLGGSALWVRRERAKAEAALAEFDFAEARRRLERCLRLRPDDPSLRLLAVQAARRDGELGAAQEQLDRYRELAGPSTPEGALEWAMIQAQRGQLAEVLAYLISCLEVRHPASEQIMEALAMGSVHVYQLDRARFWVEELLEKSPRNAIGRLIRAQTAESYGNDELARDSLRELVAEFPRHAKARLHLAQSLAKGHEYEEAIAHYEELRRQQPDRAEALLGLARCWDGLGRADEAGPLMRLLEERHPDDSEAMLECGRFALREQRPADAERLLRRAVERAPNDHQAHYYLGICLEQLGRAEEARPYLERFKQIEADLLLMEKAFAATVKAPSDPGPRLEAGRICLRNGQVTEGLRWLHGALELDPKHRPTHEALAEFYAAHGDAKRAEYHRQRAR